MIQFVATAPASDVADNIGPACELVAWYGLAENDQSLTDAAINRAKRIGIKLKTTERLKVHPVKYDNLRGSLPQ